MELLDFIKQNSNWKDLLQKDPYNIIFTENNEYLLLKYNQIKSDFNLQIVRECRGIILDKHSLEVVCRPFDKFGNLGESYVPELDWKTARVQEKVDGSIIKVWYHNGWRVSTNGSINAHTTDLPFPTREMKTFGDAFNKVFLNQFGMSFVDLNVDYTYMFELVGPFNRVVVPYALLDIYHIGTRVTSTGEELNIDIGIKKPREYTFSSLEEVVENAGALPYSNEGYVVVDGNWNRAKVKSTAYVAVHRLRGEGALTPKRVLSIIRIGEEEEFLSYFKEYKEFFDEMREKYLCLIYKCDEILYKAKNLQYESRKEFALWAKEFSCSALLFGWLDGKYSSVSDWIEELNEDKLIHFIGVYCDDV